MRFCRWQEMRDSPVISDCVGRDCYTISTQDMITGEGASRQREELKSLIFSNAERSSFSETVQGSSEGGEVDQAWLCSATSVPTLTERWNKLTEKS